MQRINIQEGRTEKKEGSKGRKDLKDGKRKKWKNIHWSLLVILTLSRFFTFLYTGHFQLLYHITTCIPPPPNKGRKTRSYLILNFLYFFQFYFFYFFSAVFSRKTTLLEPLLGHFSGFRGIFQTLGLIYVLDED